MSITDFTIQDAILHALVSDENIETKEQFHVLKNTILAEHRVAKWPSHVELIERFVELIDTWILSDSLRVRKVLRKRAVRSLSGVSVISLLTKFWWCPGKCIYCPSYENLPKSYIPNEPAVQRAEMNQFDPFLQVQNRLRSLQITGNAISKCDVRIIGGTWSVYPHDYQEEFIKNIYDAHTTFGSWAGSVESSLVFRHHDECSDPENNKTNGWIVSKKGVSKTLEEAKKRNETAESRVIGVAIETRPDWVTPEEIERLRSYGVTRVEIGYQTTHDEINILNQRWHGNAESIRATQLLKDAGFKVVAHLMPGLYGSTPVLDKDSMREVFENAWFRPDELKLYPLVVTPHSELEEVWRSGKFIPYTDNVLIPLMAELQSMIPEYVRLNRMYRDIPAEEILAGSKIANLRQVTEIEMYKRKLIRHDISAREIRAKGNLPENAILEEYFYEASGGHEWFFQMIDPHDRTIFGLLRLRIPSQVFSWEHHFLPILDNAAIIREVHVFWDQIPVGFRGDYSGQHIGFGKKLIQKAEEKVRENYPNLTKMAVIAGVWAREYYEKLDYSLQDEYMVKILTKK